MNTLRCLFCLAVFVCSCSIATAYTLTFDDIPVGWTVGTQYFNTYHVDFTGFSVADHSSSSWGPPHSGNNVAAFGGSFSFKGPSGDMYTNSVGAYFSTEMDAVLQIEAYDFMHHNLIATAQVGATGESWNNRYVEIAPAGGGIYSVYFHPVSPYDAALHFCLDDLTVDPIYVPEPSSLAALALGLVPLAAGWRRRIRGEDR